MLLPTAGAAYTHEEIADEPVTLNTNLGYYTNFVNLLDLAALAIPAGTRSNGIPFGVTLVGPCLVRPRAARHNGRVIFLLPRGLRPAGRMRRASDRQPLNFQLTTAEAS